MSDSPLSYAHDNHDRFLNELIELVSIPSASTLPEHRPDMRRAARWLVDRLNDIGVSAETAGSEDYPLVYGEWLKAPGKPTVLVYGHYDVQPAEPLELWTTPPFQPEVRDGNLYGRGSSDDKGQTLTSIYAAESYLRTAGSLPLNLKFILEGQEESGGAVIKEFVQQHGDRLKADTVQISDGHMFGPGIPTLDVGLRGIVYTEIHARGASHDLHSGLYGGVAPNPLNALAWVIASLKGPDGHITIPGFYDSVRAVPEDVLQAWSRLPVNQVDFVKEETGISELAGEQDYTPFERMWARPTLDVHGVVGGFVGEGAKTVIPAEATAKVSMRIVPDQKAEDVFSQYRDAVLKMAPPGIELEVRLIHGDDPVLVPQDSPFIAAAQTALQATFGRAPVPVRSGGSIPIVGIFKEALGLNSVLMGWGLPDDNLHAPNEKFCVQNFYDGIDATIRFWDTAAGSTRASA
jgi:acetylornithine deacetylase/succinyl-diaminopimelate desuccinylase-like protein